MSLPPPRENQAYFTVSALESGHIHVVDRIFIDNPENDNLQRIPSLSFLFQHSTNNKKLLFDLGIRKDWQNSPPKILASIPPESGVEVEQDVIESFSKRSPLFPKSQFVVGGETMKIIEEGLWPEKEDSVYTSDVIPTDRTMFLGEDITWEPIGPLSRAYDFYGDGSLYVIDAPGHLWGHINLLVRTSADGGWLYLAGDTAHHWNLITGKSGMACCHTAPIHVDEEAAEDMIRRVGEVSRLPRVRVILAHGRPWYEENEGGDAFYPGSIKSL
ncbi:hypothetical protein D9756_008239 [Leucocoprinus leucothites]|uniref:Metallo-beta-lactamase domain-containing protein n=1 Tax=Leucocoprinus leucothites TaxID=201217 RepID=A0A8H5D0H7_9AGAR|nr:hypothetical protein D9756_008239 [Leucoagaricus leucothites]